MRRKAVILTLIGIVIVCLTIFMVDTNKVLAELGKLSVEYILLIFMIQIVSNLFAALKWRVILKHSRVSMKNLIPATFVGYFINGITPIGLAGGEPVKAYIISKTDHVPLPVAASSVIVDLFLEVVPMFLLSTVSIYFIYIKAVSNSFALGLAAVAALLLVCFIFAIILVTKRTASAKILHALTRIMSKIPGVKKYAKRITPHVESISIQFNKAIRLHLLDNSIIIAATAISILVWMLRFVKMFVIFRALGFNVGFSTILIVETAVSVLSFLPLLPGALGVWESASTGLYFMVSENVTQAGSAAATLVNRFFLFFIPLVIGAIAAGYLGLNIKRITEETQAELLNSPDNS